MRAFVTGASGFIGSRLVESLIETVLGDIRDPGPWKDTLRGTDVLFHLAAALGYSQLSKDGFLEVNARGTGEPSSSSKPSTGGDSPSQLLSPPQGPVEWKGPEGARLRTGRRFPNRDQKSDRLVPGTGLVIAL